MRNVAKLLNAMRDADVIKDYAMFGAAAQMRYTEAVATFDADILVAVPNPDRLDVLTPIYEFCKAQGYEPEGDAVRVDAWPVQFIPAFDKLTEAAMQEAETVDFEGEPLRVVRADYLAVLALNVGRAKDYTRILALLESRSVTHQQISELCQKFDLVAVWNSFKSRFLDE